MSTAHCTGLLSAPQLALLILIPETANGGRIGNSKRFDCGRRLHSRIGGDQFRNGGEGTGIIEARALRPAACRSLLSHSV
jgi:hypothetical protein